MIILFLIFAQLNIEKTLKTQLREGPKELFQDLNQEFIVCLLYPCNCKTVKLYPHNTICIISVSLNHVHFVPRLPASYGRRSWLEAQLKRVTVVMPLDLHRSLKLKGFEPERTMNEIICTAVLQYIQKCGSKSSKPASDN